MSTKPRRLFLLWVLVELSSLDLVCCVLFFLSFFEKSLKKKKNNYLGSSLRQLCWQYTFPSNKNICSWKKSYTTKRCCVPKHGYCFGTQQLLGVSVYWGARRRCQFSGAHHKFNPHNVDEGLQKKKGATTSPRTPAKGIV